MSHMSEMKQRASPEVQLLNSELQINRNIPFELTPNNSSMAIGTKKLVIHAALLMNHSQFYEEKGPICCP